jgi:mRNA interferase YafQ
MRQPAYTGRFKRDLKRVERQGRKIRDLKSIMSDLINEKPLAKKHRDHALKGNWKGRRECHIAPDWLLIYKLDQDEDGSEVITFERTGSHTELFD